MRLNKKLNGLRYILLPGVFALVLLLAGCAGDSEITREELVKQNTVDAIVANTLFEYELDAAASYNIRKDGYVVIKFDQSVSPNKYTSVVNSLRENKNIKGVRAEQSGMEVCPLER